MDGAKENIRIVHGGAIKVKWYRKHEHYSTRTWYEGRKNGFKLYVDEKRRGFSSEILGYYFGANSDDLNYNSLWNDIYYKTVDEAQNAAEKWAIAAKQARSKND